MESAMEATLAFCAMVDPRVASMRPQPATFDLNTGRAYTNKEALRSKHKGSGYTPKEYTPDFLCAFHDGTSAYYEVKHRRFFDDNPDYLELPALFAEFGLKLVLVTDATLRGPLDHNSRLLRPYVGAQTREDNVSRLTEAVDQPTRIKDLVGLGFTQKELFTAILTGILAVDIHEASLVPSSIVCLAYGDLSHLEVVPT